MAEVRGIGLSGQMHGAVLLNEQGKPLRPAILWNDGRSMREAEDLGKGYPDLSESAGVIPMPGFTAPKLLWVARHEPEVFRRVAKVLLPKDYVRLLLTGDHVSDLSDASGTLWLDVRRRDWSDALLISEGLIDPDLPTDLRTTMSSEAWGRLLLRTLHKISSNLSKLPIE